MIRKELERYGADIISSDRFAKARQVPHHSRRGNIALHSLETAGYALLLVRWLERHGVTVSERDSVRASLLHDIGMTEDDVFFSPSYKKARSHPREGARIAREEFGADEVQEQAILSHMWPVWRAVPPRSMVGWVVSAADKCCSAHETKRTTDEIVEGACRWILSRVHHGPSATNESRTTKSAARSLLALRAKGTTSSSPQNKGECIAMSTRANVARRTFISSVATGSLALAGCAGGSDDQPVDATAASPQAAAEDLPWWKKTIVYEAYPKSFQSSKGGEAGDIAGVTLRPLEARICELS